MQNNLTVINIKNKNSYNCQCQCGKIFTINKYKLQKNIITKCSLCRSLDKIDKNLFYQKFIVENLSIEDLISIFNISKTQIYRTAKYFNFKKNNKTKRQNSKIDNSQILNRDKNGKYNILCSCGEIENLRLGTIVSRKLKKCKKCRNIEYQKKYGIIPKNYWNRLIDGSIKRNLEFNISLDYANKLYNGKCALSGMLICFYDYDNKIQQTASLDRIDNNKGYIEGNVQWLHKDINRLKNKYSENELLFFVDKIYSFRLKEKE